jgi:CBS domain-containing protein
MLMQREEVDMNASARAPATALRPPAEVRVSEAMHDGVLVCGRDTPLSVVATTMARERVHSIFVTDDAGAVMQGTLWGVVSDLDLVAAASVRALDQQSAGASAATAVLAVTPDETLLRATQLMTEHACAHLVVVERTSGRPVGVLSTLDVARALAGTEGGIR